MRYYRMATRTKIPGGHQTREEFLTEEQVAPRVQQQLRLGVSFVSVTIRRVSQATFVGRTRSD